MPDDNARKFVDELLKRKDFREGLKRAKSKLEIAAKEDLPKLVAAIEDQGLRLKSVFGDYDDNDWLENLLYITDIAGIDPAGLSASEIERKAMAWLKREEIRAGLRSEVEGGKSGGDPPLPVVHVTPQAAYVEWQGVKHPVSHKWADAFYALLAAKGKPTGITKHVGKTTDALQQLPAELAEILQNDGDNKGYYLTVFN